MGLAFFGLSPSYRKNIFREIHDLVFHGGGGFIYSEVYDMPIWLRRHHISLINEYFKKQEKAMKKSQQNTSKNSISKPNIIPQLHIVFKDVARHLFFSNIYNKTTLWLKKKNLLKKN